MNGRIAIDPSIQHGKPIVRGTRVPAVCIVGGLAGGMTIDQIIAEYGVGLEDIRATLDYAARLIEEETHHSLPAT
jgi:uncharacterized protein (DUF433 family)